MSDRFSLVFFCLLVVFFAAMPAAAQKAPKLQGTETVPSSQESQELKPEPPKSVINVEIKDDLLSVELANVDFRAAISAVADKAGFKIEGTGEVFSRKLNTRFTDIEIERGVLRLLSLVQESNYMLYYDTKGLIITLKIFGIRSGKAPSVTTAQSQSLRTTSIFRRPAVSSDLPPNLRPKTVRFPETRRVRKPLPSEAISTSTPLPAAQPSDAAMPQTREQNDEEEN